MGTTYSLGLGESLEHTLYALAGRVVMLMVARTSLDRPLRAIANALT